MAWQFRTYQFRIYPTKKQEEFLEKEIELKQEARLQKFKSITYYTDHKRKFVDGKLFISEKLGLIKGAFHRQIYFGPMGRKTTITKTPTGEWYVSFLTCIETEVEPKNNNGKEITIKWNGGNDVFITLSDGTKIEYPTFIKDKEKRLVHYKELMDRKFVKGAKTQSQNYYKAKLKVDKVREKIYRQKKDWLHKLSVELTDKYQYVHFEAVNFNFITHVKNLNDFQIFKSMLLYKAYKKRDYEKEYEEMKARNNILDFKGPLF